MIVREIVKREIDVPLLGQRIKQVQVDSGVSVEKAINVLGISRTYWSRVVSDREPSISIELIRKVEESFGVDLGVTFDD